MEQGKHMSKAVGAVMVSSFNLITQRTLDCEFNHRASFEARELACAVPIFIGHLLPLVVRYDGLNETATLGQGQFSREGASVTASMAIRGRVHQLSRAPHRL